MDEKTRTEREKRRAMIREEQAKRVRMCPILGPWYAECNRHCEEVYRLITDPKLTPGEQRVYATEALLLYQKLFQDAVTNADDLQVEIPFPILRCEPAQPDTETEEGDPIQ